MSLIADALKKVQSAKLGRRYLASEPTGALPGLKPGQQGGSPTSMRSLFERVELSPALVVGLVSGVVLFVVLAVYFFSGRGAKKPSTLASVASLEQRPQGLILMPPPAVPAAEPLILPKEEPPAKQPAVEQKQPAMEKKEPAAQPEQKRAARPRVKRAPVVPSAGEGLKEKAETAEVSAATELSEQVRYHFNLALSYQQERNFSAARREYESVIQLRPLYTEAHNNLGVVYRELAQYDQAVAALRRALALNPRYARAYHNLGVIHQSQGDWSQATKNYEAALSYDRNQISSYNNLGLVYRAQKRLHEAREVLEKALGVNPYFSETHYNLALVLEEIGEIEQARLHYRKFAETAGEENAQLAERVRAHLQKMAAK
jgi:tetratricopeptide (TPR) repeat protein